MKPPNYNYKQMPNQLDSNKFKGFIRMKRYYAIHSTYQTGNAPV